MGYHWQSQSTCVNQVNITISQDKLKHWQELGLFTSLSYPVTTNSSFWRWQLNLRSVYNIFILWSQKDNSSGDIEYRMGTGPKMKDMADAQVGVYMRFGDRPVFWGYSMSRPRPHIYYQHGIRYHPYYSEYHPYL